MALPETTPARAPRKSPSGIVGLDEITGGGLPEGRTTLVSAGPGAGKTVFALQFLVNGAVRGGEPGIFVAFEETSTRIIENAATFGWDLPSLQRDNLFFLDAQTSPDLVQSGDFDLEGLLAAVEAKANALGARRIVFDALDVLLTLLDDPAAIRREAHRLHHWLLTRELTGLITAKSDPGSPGGVLREPYGFLQFMVDCSILLDHEVVMGISQRNLRVMKYRGSGFDENEAPFVIGPSGLEVAGPGRLDRIDIAISNERVSTGVERLDTMLSGGYYRGSSVLVTGSPGTAKTTLCGAFAQAACLQGEKVLFVSFDSDAREVVRNLASVGIELAPLVEQGLLVMTSSRAISGNAETHLLRIRALAHEHAARYVIIDPVSAWAKAGNAEVAPGVAERLIDWTKSEGVTLFCTSLLDEDLPNTEGSPLEISTIADTWIHLSYLVQAGERNRGLSIVKSRGMAHSNQVREMILSASGVTLADPYTAGGDVLMGTMRWERELEDGIARTDAALIAKQAETRLIAEESELEARMAAMRRELEAKQAERNRVVATTAERLTADAAREARVGEIRRGTRGVDDTPAPDDGGPPGEEDRRS